MAVLPRTQAPIGQRGSAVVADGDEAAGEGDVAAAALCQQLLVLRLLLHGGVSPELVLGGQPAKDRMGIIGAFCR